MISEEELKKAMDIHGDTVYRLALCRTQNCTEAEDIYQEVFLKLLKQPSFRDEEKQKAWLLRVTINCCNDLHKSAWRTRRVPMNDIQEPVMPSENENLIWQAVAVLPDELRTVIHLYYGEGYSTEEIAKIIGKRAATVRTRMYRARKLLKCHMEENDYEELLYCTAGN